MYGNRDHCVYAPSQWETTLHCNVACSMVGRIYTKRSLMVTSPYVELIMLCCLCAESRTICRVLPQNVAKLTQFKSKSSNLVSVFIEKIHDMLLKIASILTGSDYNVFKGAHLIFVLMMYDDLICKPQAISWLNHKIVEWSVRLVALQPILCVGVVANIPIYQSIRIRAWISDQIHVNQWDVSSTS